MADTQNPNVIKTKIQLRNDRESNWFHANPTLKSGEASIVFTEDGKTKIKVGDGTKPWRQLDYVGGDTEKHYTTDDITNLSAGTYNPGDIAIETKTISGDKESKTAYVWNGTTKAWEAMDGNYNASNVYFSSDLTYTTAIGVIDAPSGSGTLPAAGKSVEDLFKQILAKESTSIDVDTGWDVTFSCGSITACEVGTSMTSSVKFTLKATDAPNWSTYGGVNASGTKVGKDGTGSEISGYILKEDGTTKVTGTKTSAAGELATYTITSSVWGATPQFTESDQTKTLTAYWSATASTSKPVTNLGNLIKSGTTSKITETFAYSSDNYISAIGGFNEDKDNEKTATAKIPAGYRNMFYGSNTSVKELNSANIRQLTSEKTKTGTTSVTVVEGALHVIIAVPSARKVTAVKDEGAFGTDIFSEFKLTENVDVEGANGFTAAKYKVYQYTPLAALGANTYTVTIE